MVWDTDLALVVEPFRGRVGKLGTAMALYAGMGAVRTEDETTAGRGDGEPRFADTQSQVHPSGVWGVLGDVYLNERVGLRFRWHHMSYIETVDSTITSMKTNGRVGFEAVFVLDDPSRAPLRRSP